LPIHLKKPPQKQIKTKLYFNPNPPAKFFAKKNSNAKPAIAKMGGASSSGLWIKNFGVKMTYPPPVFLQGFSAWFFVRLNDDLYHGFL